MHTLFKKIVPIFGVFLMVASLITTNITHAAGNILYITPTTSQLTVGGTINVTVKGFVANTSNVGSVSGTLTYPPGQLRVLGTSTTGSAYTNPTVSTGSSSINFSGTRNPSPTGQIPLIFTITFQAVGSGSAVVGFSGNSNLNQATTRLDSATFTVSSPAPAPAPTPTPTPAKPTPSPAPAPAPTPTPTPAPTEEQTPAEAESEEDITTPDSTGLIAGVSRVGSYTSATVTWGITTPTGTSDLLYGSSSDDVTTKATVTKNADGKFTASIPNISPGNRYFFTISATGEGGKAGTYSGTVSTLGYPVVIKVTNGGEPIVNAGILIGQQRYATTREGTSTLKLAEDTYAITIATGTSTRQERITVAKKAIPTDGSAPEKQTFNFDIPAVAEEKEPISPFVFIGVMVGGVAILTVGFLVFVTIKRRRFETGAGYTNTTATTAVVINDGYDWRAEQLQQMDTPEPNLNAETPTNLATDIYSHHNNSVHLDEEEPKDMFELAKEQSLRPDQESSPTPTVDRPISSADDWPQSPNQPHSTTL